MQLAHNRQQKGTPRERIENFSSGFQAHQIKKATIVCVTEDSCLTLFEPAMGPATMPFTTTGAILISIIVYRPDDSDHVWWWASNFR